MIARNLLQTGWDKTLPDLAKWTVGLGWIVVLQCIAMILLNVMCALHFTLVFYETPERGKLARQVESC